MNILYHLASPFMRNIYDAYQTRKKEIVFKKENSYTQHIEFESVSDDHVHITRYTHPKVYFKVNVNNHSPKIYPLDGFLLKKLFKKLKSEATDISMGD